MSTKLKCTNVLNNFNKKKFEAVSASAASVKQIKTKQAPAIASGTNAGNSLRVNSAYRDSKKVLRTRTPATGTANTSGTHGITAGPLSSLTVSKISKSPDKENATEVLPPPPPPRKVTTLAKDLTVENLSKSSNNRVNSSSPTCRAAASRKRRSLSAKSAANQWKSPFKSFVSRGVRLPNICNPDCDLFAYHLSRDELKYLDAFKSPMKPAPASERELLQSGKRIQYLNQRYEYSPNRKYNYPEATSWRIGWLHNRHGQGDNRKSPVVHCF